VTHHAALEVITRKPPHSAKPTPLLFVPGAWHAAWCWDVHFLPYFAAQGYEAHALSLRGHGGSAGKEKLRWTRLSDYVEDVAKVADGLRSRPVVIGHSMGGFVVQKYLERLSAPLGVLMASAPVHGIIPSSLRGWLRDPVTVLRSNLSLSPYHLVGTAERAQDLLFSKRCPEDLLTTYHARLEEESLMALVSMMFLELPRPKRVKTPLLVLGAEHDNVFSTTDTMRTAKAYNTTATIFPDMAHDMMLDPRWEEVAAYVLAQLTERGL
jgi:pimeloyl-ACP methyl ester carboxylesterase